MLTSSEWLILMWRAPVYVRHTSLPDPQISIFILCWKEFEMWFLRLILIPNMQRPWRRKRRRRVEPSSSLHAALLSCTGTILVVVHLVNHYFHHHHTPHRCLARKVVLMGMLVMIILSDGSVKSRFLIRVWRYPYWNEIAGNRGVKMVVEGGGCEDDGGIFTSTISW